jgi:hypothetical protein
MILKLRTSQLGVLILAIVLIRNVAVAAPEGSVPRVSEETITKFQQASEEKVQFEFTPYFWLAGIDGDSTIGNQTANIDLSFCDITDKFDVWALMGRFETHKGDWGCYLDGSYISLDGDFVIETPGPTFDGSVVIRDSILDFGVTHKLFKKPYDSNPKMKAVVEPLGGLRYHYLKQEISVLTTRGGSEDWVEPFVGARLSLDITEKLAFKVHGDIGGFGIGSASDLTWNVLAGVDWRFHRSMSLKAAYRILDLDYLKNGGTSEALGFDGQFSGPLVGLSFYW